MGFLVMLLLFPAHLTLIGSEFPNIGAATEKL